MIDDFVATFGINDRPIYMALCSKLVWGGLLDTGYRPSVVMIDTSSKTSVVDDSYRFPTYNKLFKEYSSKIFENLRCNSVSLFDFCKY